MYILATKEFRVGSRDISHKIPRFVRHSKMSYRTLIVLRKPSLLRFAHFSFVYVKFLSTTRLETDFNITMQTKMILMYICRIALRDINFVKLHCGGIKTNKNANRISFVS